MERLPATLRTVNRVYTGSSVELATRTLSAISLHCQKHGYNNIRLYSKRPYMLRIRYEKNTVLIFSNGKLRLMGAGFSNLDCAKSTVANMLHIHDVTLEHVSSTVCLRLDLTANIDLFKFAQQYWRDMNVVFEPEIFPAIQLTKWKGVNANLFHTGSIVIMGRNAETLTTTIIDWILTNLP